MTRTRGILLGVALCLAAQALPAQQAPGAPRHAPTDGAAHDPFRRLLERREELGLTAQQVSQIEAVRARLEAQNRPLREQMQAARSEAGLPRPPAEARGGERPRPTEEQRAAMRQLRERMQPVAEQMQRNRRAAMEEVRRVLTEEQRARLRRAHEHCRGRRGPGRPGRRPGREGAPRS